MTTDPTPTPQALPLTLPEFARMAGFPLAGFQIRALGLEKKITCIVGPRQSGKTRALALLGLWWCFRRPSQKVLIVSAGDEASKRVVAAMSAIVQGSRLLRGSVLDRQQSLLSISNGSQVRAVPASEWRIRGETVDLGLLDEAALVSDDVGLGAFLPTVSARPDSRVVMVSSASVASGFFFDSVRAGEGHSDHIETHYWDLADCEWISASTREALRQSMSEQRWSAEFGNVFGGTSDTIFTRQLLDPCRVDYLQDPLPDVPGPSRVFGGHDWAWTGPDHSATVLLGRLAIHGSPTFAVRCAHRWPQGYPSHATVADIANSTALYDVMTSEVNGGGGPITEMLWRAIFQRSRADGGGNPERVRYVVVEEQPSMMGPAPMPKRRPTTRPAEPTVKRPFFTSAQNKAVAYSHERLMYERGRLLIPTSAEDLYREKLNLKVDLTATGTEKIAARGGGHDDLADAMALSLAPYRDRNGVWRTMLSDLADPTITDLPVPILPDAMGRVDLLPGPGDLLIPRAPAWMSVRGSEVTLPRDLDLVSVEMREMQRRVRRAFDETQRVEGAVNNE